MDDAAPIRTVRCFTSVDEDTDDMVDGLLCGMCYIYGWICWMWMGVKGV